MLPAWLLHDVAEKPCRHSRSPASHAEILRRKSAAQDDTLKIVGYLRALSGKLLILGQRISMSLGVKGPRGFARPQAKDLAV